MKALLVDDSKSARFFLRTLLTRKGLDIVMAESGEEALKVLERETVDIVLMDNTMPGLSGLDTTRKIKENPETRDIPVALCTSHEGPGFEAEVKAVGAVGILPKPPQEQQLTELLEKIEALSQPAAPAPAAAPAVDMAAIDQLVNERIGQLMENQLKPWVREVMESSLSPANEAIAELRDRIEKTTLANQSLGQQLETLSAGKQAKSDANPATMERMESTIATLSSQTEHLSLDLQGQQSEIDRLQEQLESMPDLDRLLQLEKQIRQMVNEQVAALKDWEGGRSEEMLSRVKSQSDEIKAGLMKQVYTVVGAAAAIVLVVTTAIHFIL